MTQEEHDREVRKSAEWKPGSVAPGAEVVTTSKRISGISPTQRTLKELRQLGRICGIVERFNSHAGPHGIRIDLFGFIDLVALDPQQGIIGVQCCAGSGHAAHRRKILEECNQEAMEWLRCGGKIELWSWSKRLLKRGGKAMRWCPRVEEITMEALTGDAGEG